MPKDELQLVQVPLDQLEYKMENIILRVLRKYDRIKILEQAEETLLNKKDAAISLGVSYNTLKSLIKKGAIKTTIDGTRVPRSSIEEYKSSM